MEFLPLVLSLFTAGYILGVWTACMVFKHPQRADEDAASPLISSSPLVVLSDPLRAEWRRR